MRSMRSDVVRAVRDESDESLVRSVSMTVMHFHMGIEGNNASASKETRSSSASSLVSFIFLTKSKEFLQANGEFFNRGRRRGMRKAESAS